MFMRKFAFMLLALALLVPVYGAAGEKATVYKDPGCGCCNEYVAHLRQQGFDVTAINTSDLSAVKRQYGVPAELESCHTVLVGGYVVEGHVPADVVRRLLVEKPNIKGISLPGMPMGSPGMGGPKSEPFVIHGFSDNGSQVYAIK